jgi:hypothetical protein
MRFFSATAGRWLIGLVVSLGVVNPLPGAPPGKGPLRLGSTADRLDTQEYYRFRDLNQGAQPIVSFDPAETAANRAVLDKAARWYVYRLAWSEYQSGQGASGMHTLVEEALRQIPLPRPRQPLSEEQQNYLKVFGGLLQERVQEVLRDPQPIVRVNAVRLLAHLAAAGRQEVVDVLLALLKDPAENDGVKLFALRGLKSLLAQGAPGKAVPADATRWESVVRALIAYIERKPSLTADAPLDEVDGYRYVRREAVRGLALAVNVPAGVAPDLPRQAALTLLRVLYKEQLLPEASLAEQVEASAGLCRMHQCFTTQEAETAIHRLGRFVVEYVEHYVREAQRPGGAVQVPWKLYAMRLRVALEELKSAKLDAAHQKLTESLIPQASLLLARIDWGRELPNPVELDAWLRKHPPADPTIFNPPK